MPRPLRILFPNACYHVMNRGANKRPIYAFDFHRHMFLETIKEAQQMFNIVIHAYCLMGNHYHLLISTPDANLPEAMRHINGVYTQRYHRSENSDGPLFRGRYKAQLVEDGHSQLIVSRYIHLNPVRANMVRLPEEYKWSSYPIYLGQKRKPSWLTTNMIQELISARMTQLQIRNYQDYIEKTKHEDMETIFNSINAKPIIGSNTFKEKILKQIDATTMKDFQSDIKRIRQIPKIEIIISAICKYYGVPFESILYAKRGQLNWPRLICIYTCRKRFGHPTHAISKILNSLSRNSVCTATARVEKEIKNQPKLMGELDAVFQWVKNEMKNSNA